MPDDFQTFLLEPLDKLPAGVWLIRQAARLTRQAARRADGATTADQHQDHQHQTSSHGLFLLACSQRIHWTFRCSSVRRRRKLFSREASGGESALFTSVPSQKNHCSTSGFALEVMSMRTRTWSSTDNFFAIRNCAPFSPSRRSSLGST